MDKKWIEVAGGGDSSEPTRTPDSLLSQDYFEVLLALSEGPIKGLVSASNNLENFFAGDTPAFNLATGQANFSDFSATLYTGTDQDSPIKMQLGGAAANVSINVTLGSATPVVRQTPGIQRGLFDQIEVRLRFDYLAKTTNDGSFETTAEFRLEYKRASSGTWLHFENTNPVRVTGKTTTGYARDFIIPVAAVPEDYDLRVTKVSPDGVQGVDDEVVAITWESYQLVKLGDVQYPGLALMHIYGKASNQFTSIPEFSGVYDGMIVRVPTNYNPVTRVYDESTPWNGTFKNAHTSNGPWILYELLTNERWGLSRYYKGVTVNRYEFYEEAKWCDQMVPDGRGGTQPRFTYNDWITEARSGPDLLKYIAGSFNAVLDDDGNGYVTLRSDRPRAAAQVFTPENVTPAGFNYTFTDVTVRHNDIRVAFVNPDLDWEEDWRQATIDNTEAIAQNGRVPFDFVAVGCIDANEAVRRANYRYVTANEEVTTCSFTTARNGLLCNLFDTVYIADPSADWGNSARVKTATTTTIHLRDPMWFPDLLQRNVKVQTYTGLAEIQITPLLVGENYTLSVVGGNFPVGNVPPNTVFTVEDAAGIGLAKPFRVIGFGEVDGKPDEIELSVHEIAVGKYEQVETGLGYVPSQFAFSTPGEATLPSSMSVASPQPTVNSDGTLTYALEVSWRRPIGANTERFEIDFKRDGDTTWSTVVSRGDRAMLTPVSDGKDYIVRLYAVSPLGHRSQRCLEQTATVLSKAGALENVLGLTVVSTPNGWEARWSAPIDIPDFDGTDIRIGTTASTDFPSLPPRFTTVSLRQTIPWLSAGTHRVMAKFRSRSKNYSADAAIFDIVVSNPATPILEVNRGLDNTLLRFQDCTTSQPLQDILVRMGTETSTWDSANPTAGGGANQRSVNVIPSAVNITKVYVRARDVAGNLSNVATETIPPATGDIQALLDLINTGITEDSLSPSLLSTIQLITAPDTTAGSVNARVKAETDARVQALSTETSNRNQAIADAEQRVTAQFGLADGVVLAAAKAYTYSKVEADQATAGQINTYNAALTGPAGPIQAAVNTESLARANVDGHLGAQWTVKVGLATPGGPAEIAGIAVAGTSTPTQGARFDMAFRANAFYFLPPAGQDNTPYQPLVYYPTNQVIDGVSVPAGLYIKSAFIDYIKASQIDTRGIAVKDTNGTILFGSGTNLDWTRINASNGWLNNQITVSAGGVLQNIGSANVVVDNSKVGGVNMVWGPGNGPVSAGSGVYGVQVFPLKNNTTNPYGLRPGESLSLSADIWMDATAFADGQNAVCWLIAQDINGNWISVAEIRGTTTTRTRQSASMTLPATEAGMYLVQVMLYHQPQDGNHPGSVTVDRVQVERGPVATQYAPGAEPGATIGATVGVNVKDSVGNQLQSRDLLNNEDSIIRAPGGGHLTTTTSTLTGSIKIRLPVFFTDTMVLFFVDIYEYLGGYSCSLQIGGYTGGGGSWVNVTARVVGGSNVEYPVYFGHDGVKACVWIDVPTAQWSYPQVRVRDVFLGYNNVSKNLWDGGWQVSVESWSGASGIGASQYSAAVTDTYPGADWGKTARRPANVAALSGTEAIRNDLIAIPKGTMNADPACEKASAWIFANAGAFLDTTISSSSVGRGMIVFRAPFTDCFADTAETIPINPSKRYRLTARLLAAPGNDRNAYLFVRMFRADNTELTGVHTGWGGSLSGYVYGSQPPQSTWTEYGDDFGSGTPRPIPSDVSYVRVGVWGRYSGAGSSNADQYAQDVRLTEVTDVRAASLAAQTAQGTADSVNTIVSRISDDGWLTKSEKPEIILKWQTIDNEYPFIAGQADVFGIVGEKTNYVNARDALATFLGQQSPAWNDVGSDTPVNGPALRAAFANLYYYRQLLLNRIDGVASTTAVWGNVASRPGNVAALSGAEAIRNDQIGINASGQLYGAGAGNGVVVSNNQLSIDAQGRLYSAGSQLSGQVTYAGLGGGAMGLINAINSVNVDTYIQGAAIGLAKINTASITNLAALSATVGLLRTATSGGRVEIADNVIRVYDDSNQLRVKIGNLTL